MPHAPHAKPRERDGRIKVIEDAHCPRCARYQLGRRHSVGAVGSYDRGISIGDFVLRLGADFRPLTIKYELSAWDCEQIAIHCVIRDVSLEKHHPMAMTGERAAKSAPERRMAVPPGRTDGQAEDDDLHAVTASLSESKLHVCSPTAIVVTLAGAISILAKSLSGIPKQ